MHSSLFVTQNVKKTCTVSTRERFNKIIDFTASKGTFLNETVTFFFLLQVCEEYSDFQYCFFVCKILAVSPILGVLLCRYANVNTWRKAGNVIVFQTLRAPQIHGLDFENHSIEVFMGDGVLLATKSDIVQEKKLLVWYLQLIFA